MFERRDVRRKLCFGEQERQETGESSNHTEI